MEDFLLSRQFRLRWRRITHGCQWGRNSDPVSSQVLIQLVDRCFPPGCEWQVGAPTTDLGCTVGIGIGLLGVNTWRTSGAPNDSPEPALWLGPRLRPKPREITARRGGCSMIKEVFDLIVVSGKWVLQQLIWVPQW